jgi:hypothetical protein
VTARPAGKRPCLAHYGVAAWSYTSPAASGRPGAGGVGSTMRLLAARSLLLVIAWVTPVLTFDLSLAGEPRPRSILVLEQSDVRGPFYGAIYSGLESRGEYPGHFPGRHLC